MSNFEDNFNDKNIEKAIKKAKFKSLFRNIVIGSGVFMIGIVLNSIYNINTIKKQEIKLETMIQNSVPNGYISSANYSMGFLGGNVQYEISKNIGKRQIVLSNESKAFGINPPFTAISNQDLGESKINEWPTDLWKSGYRKMLFFHPKINYKKYKNDLKYIDNIPDDKIIEMAISLDKEYKKDELSEIAFDLRNLSINYIWLDTYNEKDMMEYKKEVKEYDPKACGIRERDVRGLNYTNYGKDGLFAGMTHFQGVYDLWVDSMQESKNEEDKVQAKDAQILGFIVEGNKNEIKELMNKPYIKAASFGVIVDPIY